MTTAIIPLAGRSSRFSSITSTPKWGLHLGNKSILEYSLESLSLSRLPLEHFVFIVLEHHVTLFEHLVRRSGIQSFEIIPTTETPNGQAKSVELGLRHAGVNGAFVVWNGDTHLKSGWDTHLKPRGNWMLLSQLPGEHWSFAVTENFQVTETAEKVRVSDLASVGLYGFSDPRDFCRALDGFSGPGEAFVAPLYNHIIRNGNLVEALEIDSSFVVPLGTPGEVCEACISNNWPLPVEVEPWCIESRIATKR